MRVVRKPRIGNRSKVDMLVGTVTGGLILGLDTRAGIWNWVLLLGDWNWNIDTGGPVWNWWLVLLLVAGIWTWGCQLDLEASI